MKRTKIVESEDEDAVSALPVEPLTPEEVTDIRWLLFGKCPVCGNYVKDWSPGAFNPERYRYWQDHGVDALTGHKATCTEKWRRA